MANVVKIKEVLLYVGYTANAQQCYLMKKYLEDNNVAFNLMNYGDDSHHQDVFGAMSTWNYGRPGEQVQHNITDFPFVTWKEYYDDFEQGVHISFSTYEIHEKLLPKKDLIV